MLIMNVEREWDNCPHQEVQERYNCLDKMTLVSAFKLLTSLLAPQELHFVASDIALELIGDFAVVCLLSPKRSFKQRPTSGLGQAIAGLPGHAFQVTNGISLISK